ncbi:uncharacterized protein LACBIDRAFT_310529 [Laccaria bicolor S238N-H82]|uniref:Predicted protein n=1 Tax=Laccaria bicolor (strain S238N-H82 / ATCC MYA-4686) TaxID=486041 RepID=B0DUJ0_LACBS|nr:uncharacterized protein LACBIDRAFT_310529 [Laccaria bicolor S238N-H82]EDR01748.1 predicted protein [Laccaria bicolor S238N-H82]|eukprot:XP_001887561.1 predicted protein [Laccaria bicolor S238N-H82]
MSSSTLRGVDDYPSMLWVVIPPVLLLSAYFTRRWYVARRLRVHGIGKGAPGFQTNVRQLRVTPEIAARLRRGEKVSPEEIAAAAAKAQEEEQKTPYVPRIIEERHDRPKLNPTPPPAEPVNEWLPESLTGPKKRVKGKRR